MKVRVRIDIVNDKNPCSSILNFYPEEAITPWDEIEISPVTEYDGVCEVTEEGKESFWSVYLHQIGGGVKCIADLPYKKQALFLAKLISNCANTRIHSIH